MQPVLCVSAEPPDRHRAYPLRLAGGAARRGIPIPASHSSSIPCFTYYGGFSGLSPTELTSNVSVSAAAGVPGLRLDSPESGSTCGGVSPSFWRQTAAADGASIRVVPRGGVADPAAVSDLGTVAGNGSGAGVLMFYDDGVQ